MYNPVILGCQPGLEGCQPEAMHTEEGTRGQSLQSKSEGEPVTKQNSMIGKINDREYLE